MKTGGLILDRIGDNGFAEQSDELDRAKRRAWQVTRNVHPKFEIRSTYSTGDNAQA